MKIIAQIKLNPTPDQHAALQRTLEQANAARSSTRRWRSTIGWLTTSPIRNIHGSVRIRSGRMAAGEATEYAPSSLL